MTKEDIVKECKRIFNKNYKNKNDYELLVVNLLVNIFEDIDNQVCKNCIHYDKDDKVCILLDMGVLDNTFGCKAFKPKGGLDE